MAAPSPPPSQALLASIERTIGGRAKKWLLPAATAAEATGAFELDGRPDGSAAGLHLPSLHPAFCSYFEVAAGGRLKRLTLTALGLTAVPEALGALIELTGLKLRHNQIVALPAALCELPRLQRLDLSHNRLLAFPRGLAALPALRELRLAHNGISALPSELAQLSVLEVLDLAHNALDELPGFVGGLSQLRLLDVSANRLTAIPTEVLDREGHSATLVTSSVPCLPVTCVTRRYRCSISRATASSCSGWRATRRSPLR